MKEDMLVQDTNVVDEQEEGTTSDQPTIESLTAERDQLVEQLQAKRCRVPELPAADGRAAFGAAIARDPGR